LSVNRDFSSLGNITGLLTVMIVGDMPGYSVIVAIIENFGVEQVLSAIAAAPTDASCRQHAVSDDRSLRTNGRVSAQPADSAYFSSSVQGTIRRRESHRAGWERRLKTNMKALKAPRHMQAALASPLHSTYAAK
jgi:hypothetical protein